MTQTRLARNVSGRSFHRMFPKWKRRAYTWAINLKPGTVFNSYDGWNHRVRSIKIEWSNVSEWPRYLPSRQDYGKGCRGTFVEDVRITSHLGSWHCISETGCIVPRFSRAQIVLLHGPQAFDFAQECGIVDAEGLRLRETSTREGETLTRLYEATPHLEGMYESLAPDYQELR